MGSYLKHAIIIGMNLPSELGGTWWIACSSWVKVNRSVLTVIKGTILHGEYQRNKVGINSLNFYFGKEILGLP